MFCIYCISLFACYVTINRQRTGNMQMCRFFGGTLNNLHTIIYFFTYIYSAELFFLTDFVHTIKVIGVQNNRGHSNEWW